MRRKRPDGLLTMAGRNKQSVAFIGKNRRSKSRLGTSQNSIYSIEKELGHRRHRMLVPRIAVAPQVPSATVRRPPVSVVTTMWRMILLPIGRDTSACEGPAPRGPVERRGRLPPSDRYARATGRDRKPWRRLMYCCVARGSQSRVYWRANRYAVVIGRVHSVGTRGEYVYHRYHCAGDRADAPATRDKRV